MNELIKKLQQIKEGKIIIEDLDQFEEDVIIEFQNILIRSNIEEEFNSLIKNTASFLTLMNGITMNDSSNYFDYNSFLRKMKSNNMFVNHIIQNAYELSSIEFFDWTDVHEIQNNFDCIEDDLRMYFDEDLTPSIPMITGINNIIEQSGFDFKLSDDVGEGYFAGTLFEYSKDDQNLWRDPEVHGFQWVYQDAGDEAGEWVSGHNFEENLKDYFDLDYHEVMTAINEKFSKRNIEGVLAKKYDKSYAIHIISHAGNEMYNSYDTIIVLVD